MKALRGACVFIASVLLTGCDLVTRNCELYEVHGIFVGLMDARAGGPIVSDDIEVTARDGDYIDTFRSSAAAWLAAERAGVYQVEARAVGYLPWDTSGVVVKQDGCHVRSEEFTVHMQPTGAD